MDEGNVQHIMDELKSTRIFIESGNKMELFADSSRQGT